MHIVRVRAKAFLRASSALGLALACLLAPSCRKVSVEVADSAAIGFSALETKAGATAANIAANGSAFIVNGSLCQNAAAWSSSSDVSVFNNVVVTSNGSAWTYSPLQYWALSSKYHFRAAWPASAFGTSAATYTDGLEGNASITGFTVGANADVDMLLSDLVEVSTDASSIPSSTSLSSGKVKFTFGHLLSKVSVSVAQQDSGGGLRIREVKISGMKASGSFSGTSTTGTWTTSGEAVSRSKSFSTAQALDGTNFYSVWSDGLYLIPQSLSGITLSVTFQEGTSGEPQTLTANLGSSSWLQGKSYEYKATLTAKKIEFTVKVVDWVDGATVTLQK